MEGSVIDLVEDICTIQLTLLLLVQLPAYPGKLYLFSICIILYSIHTYKIATQLNTSLTRPEAHKDLLKTSLARIGDHCIPSKTSLNQQKN